MSTPQNLSSLSVPAPLPAICADFLTAAERELDAFTTAVRQTQGNQAADRAAEYWFQEFDKLSTRNAPTAVNWRQISVLAASRLALENSPTKKPRFFLKPLRCTPVNNASKGDILDTARLNLLAFLVYTTKDLVALVTTL